MAVAGVALGASQINLSASSQASHVVDLVVPTSPARKIHPVVHRATVKPAASNRAVVYLPPPASSSPPSISGSAVQGQTLTEVHGAWSSSPTSYSYQWQRCENSGSDCVAIAGATGLTYLLALADVGASIRVAETASNSSGSGSAALSAQSAIVQAPSTLTTASIVAPPVLGQRGIAAVIAGKVRIRLRGTSGFVSLTSSMSIPNGSEVDATDGRVLITVASATPGKTSSAEVYGGAFLFDQKSRGAGKAELRLSLPLTGCRGSAVGAAPGGLRGLAAKHDSKPSSRRLWVAETGGSWGTSGRYVSTTVEGTHWLTLDECDRSEVKVLAGRVRVLDLVSKITRIVSTGQQYVAVK
jgi:hypothetical protein